MENLNGGFTVTPLGTAGTTRLDEMMFPDVGGQSVDTVRTILPVVGDASYVTQLVPPRAGNFLPVPTVDDFSRLYLPLCLAPVFVVLGAQKLFPGVFWKRVVFGVGGTLVCAAVLLLTLAAGEDASPLALRAGVLGVLLTAGAFIRRR